MSAFLPQLVRAMVSGAAVETGRAAARRNGLGFLQWDDPTDWGNNWDWWFGNDGGGSNNDWGGYFFDDYGNYYEYDWFNAGGGPEDYYSGLDYGFYTVGDTTYTFDPDNFAQPNYPSYRDITGNLDYQNSLWDWLTNLGPGPAQLDPQYGPAGTGQELPGYCPKGTYHPVNEPMACVPFPPNDPNAKKQASAQQKAQQAAANAAKKAQQQQDKACPKHPQGLPVWRNPQTGKCEVVPQCPQGAKFDSTTRRCLTPAQAKELYGDNNWLWWLLIGGGALLLVTRNNSSGGRRR